jgi:hypothetical protein
MAPPRQPKPWYHPYQVWFKQNCGSLILVVFTALGAVKFSNELHSEFQMLSNTLKDTKDIVFPLKSVIEVSTISRTTTNESVYISRPFLENVVASFSNNSPDMQYLVLYGPRGFGKSSVVEHTLNKRLGVINIRCVEGPTPESFLPNIFQVIAGQKSSTESRVSRDDLVTTLLEARSMLPRRVIIFDISSSIVPVAMRTSAVKVVSDIAKDISNYVPCIVILSEANAVVEFQDRSRIQYQLVEEMTENEAIAVLKTLWNEKMLTQPHLPNMTSQMMMYIFEHLGRSPQDLKSLVKQVAAMFNIGPSCPSLEDVVRQNIEVQIQMAAQDLHRYPRAYHPLLYALKKNPEGVIFSSIDYVEWARDAKQSNNNAILYDMMNASFKFQKTLYKSAIKRFD